MLNVNKWKSEHFYCVEMSNLDSDRTTGNSNFKLSFTVFCASRQL